MKKIITKITLIAMFLSPAIAFAEVIKNIEIYGLNSISRGTVLSYLPVEVGDDYNDLVSNNIIKSLYKTGFFRDIEISQSKNALKINVLENPNIKYIDILNYSNNVVDKDNLDRILQNLNLTQGEIFNKRKLDSIINQLNSLYLSKGYYNIDIVKKIETDNQNRIGIELYINEGEVARITSMKINGAKIKDTEDLLAMFEIGEPDIFFLNYFTRKDHFSKIALDAGIEAIKSDYINSGYLDFKVKSVDTNLSDDKENISINININEGNQYKISSINFTGDLLNQSIESLNNTLTIAKGDVFERKKVIESIQSITDIFSDQGYAFAKIDPITKENNKTHEIELSININLNKKIYINRIAITGNTRTIDEVIRREIGIVEGGLYSSTELDKSIKRIKRLGFFSDVKMEVSKLKNFPDKMNIHFSVEETKTGTFSIGLSHSNSSGASFNAGIQEKNFLGTGNTLDANFSSSDAVEELNFYFSDPYFNEDHHSISYGFFSKNLDGAGLDVSSYKVNERGVNVGYGVPLTEDTRINTDIRMSTRDITCGETFSDANHESKQCSSGDSSEIKVNLNWSNNTLDNYNFPTEGKKNNISFDLALPIADFQYYKLDASHKSYYPIPNNSLEDLVFTLKGRVGLAQGYGDNDLPFFKRYYGGGSSSVRGFDFNSLGATYNDGKAKGGELSLLAGTSVIAPMEFITDSKNMRMSAFIDAGSINEKISNFELDEIRASTGIAFLWITPVGPLGIYAAKPLLKKSSDKTKTVEFTLGTNF